MMSPSNALQSVSPYMGERQLSSVTLHTNSSGKTSVGWRSEAPWQRRYRQSNEFYSDSKSADGRNINDGRARHEAKDPIIPKKLYIDQQTGEMIRSSTGIPMPRTLANDAVTEPTLFKRKLTDQKLRRRASRQATPPSAERSFWDQSLKTHSMSINQRSSLPPPSFNCSSRLNLPKGARFSFPRLTHSADCISTLDLSTRYPRGQQRPSGLASGHHALLLRHKQILDASKKATYDLRWHQLRQKDAHLLHALREQHPDIRVRFLNETNHHLPKEYPTRLKPTSYYDVTINRRCSQEAAASLSKSNKKCQEWFNTWVED